ncbi:MAG: MerR family transcriptional regulator [Rhodoferax sp.]
MENSLPPIPAKRYFTIGEVGELCGVKPHVLRYWEQEFTQLRPMKRRGNRRYYQHHEVLMIRRIRELLYDQGFTISGARNKMQEMGHDKRHLSDNIPEMDEGLEMSDPQLASFSEPDTLSNSEQSNDPWRQVRHELHEIRALLSPAL